MEQTEEYFLTKLTQAGTYILQWLPQALERVHRQVKQAEDHVYDRLHQ